MPFNIGPQNVVDQIKIKAQLSDLAAAFKTRLLWFLAKFFSVFFFLLLLLLECGTCGTWLLPFIRTCNTVRNC